METQKTDLIAQVPQRKLEAGIKYDGGKLRYDLIPVLPLRLLAEVYTIGAKKYADRNWEKGISYSRIIGALMRHLEAFRAGESYDSEGGQHHLASVAWCAFALMEYERTHPELDDRPSTLGNQTRAEDFGLDHRYEPVPRG